MGLRRRVLTGIALVFTIYLLLRSSSSESSSAPGFYSKTLSRVNANAENRYTYTSSFDSRNKIEHVGSSGSSGTNEQLEDEDAGSTKGRSDRLREAEALAKDNANRKAPNRESIVDAAEEAEVEDVDEASKRYRAGVDEIERTGEPENPNVVIANNANANAGAGAGGSAGQNRNLRAKPKEASEKSEKEIEESNFASDILDDYLKMAPIVIFSKSYCPHSKRAKTILLEAYNILPRPFVVELDQEEHGTSIQALLSELTGRTTVPNVLVQGRSIGGGSEIAKLDEEGELEKAIRKMEMGLPRRITKIERVVRDIEDSVAQHLP